MYEEGSRTASDAGHLHRALVGRLSGDTLGLEGYVREDPSAFETGWRQWLPAMLPSFLTNKETEQLIPFGEHHGDLWDWAWSLQLGYKSAPMVCIWPRGGGKSSTAEMVGAMVGALRKRRYVLYISETLGQAEDHVQNVAGIFESRQMERYYPHVAHPMVGKSGNQKGWNRKRLRAASGFTVDALGLDVSARGVKLDDMRPDLIIIDDIDGEMDGPHITQKKINILTKKFLPTGSRDVAVLAVQNLIIPDGIFSRLANGTADFLYGRTVSGPFPAVYDLEYEFRDGTYHVTGGRPIWAGMDLRECEFQINDRGLSSFLTESQQEVDDVEGGMFGHLDFARIQVSREQLPEILTCEVWVDPAVTETDNSDSNGIIIDALGVDGKIYRLWSWEHRAGPEHTLILAIAKALEYGAVAVGVETNQGGDTWRITFDTLIARLQTDGLLLDERLIELKRDEDGRIIQAVPRFKSEKATTSTGGKAERAGLMLTAYEQDQFRHVAGTHHVLERALKRFLKVKPYDLADAAYWSFHSLTDRPKKMRVYV